MSEENTHEVSEDRELAREEVEKERGNCYRRAAREAWGGGEEARRGAASPPIYIGRSRRYGVF